MNRECKSTLNRYKKFLTFCNLLALRVEEFLFLDKAGSQKSHDPDNKVLLLILKEANSLVDLLVDLHGELDLQLVGEFLHEKIKVA